MPWMVKTRTRRTRSRRTIRKRHSLTLSRPEAMPLHPPKAAAAVDEVDVAEAEAAIVEKRRGRGMSQHLVSREASVSWVLVRMWVAGEVMAGVEVAEVVVGVVEAIALTAVSKSLSKCLLSLCTSCVGCACRFAVFSLN